MAFFLGIDLGTSTLKVLVVDEKGRTCAISQKPYPVKFDKITYAEQDPKDWCDALEEAFEEIRQKCDLSKVLSIGFSGQMHGMVIVDKDGDIIRPSIIWMDQRTASESQEIAEIAGKVLINSQLINRPTAGMLICSLYWLKKYEAYNYEKIYKVMSPKDYLRFWLTGQICTDETDASATLAFSIIDRQWSYDLINKLGLNPEIFTEVKKSSDNAGRLKNTLANKFGFNSNVFIAAGGGDSAMQLLGNGIIKEGALALNIGTASQIATTIKSPISDKEKRLQTWCHGLDNTWYIQGGALSGGSALKWFKSNIIGDYDIDYNLLDEYASNSEVGSDGLIFLPYLSGSRTPNLNPYARGVFFGLTMKHKKSDMIRAIMEGVIYNLNQSYKILTDIGINSKILIASGGGANGELWKQIQADVLGIPVYTTKVDEEACLGAAIEGAVGQGYFISIEDACGQMIELNDNPILPDKSNCSKYDYYQGVFNDLYERNADLFEKLNYN